MEKFQFVLKLLISSKLRMMLIDINTGLKIMSAQNTPFLFAIYIRRVVNSAMCDINHDILTFRAGGKANAVQTCHVCRGSGTKISLVQIGPGMVQQTQRMCPECHGEGAFYAFLFFVENIWVIA